MYAQGKSHLVTMLCLLAGVLGLFFCPEKNASALPAFFMLLAGLAGAQTYRSIKGDQSGTDKPDPGARGRNDA